MRRVAAVCLPDTASLPASPVNLPANSLVLARCGNPAPATPLFATLPRQLASVDSKWFADKLSPLLATLTKNPGAGSIILVTPSRLSYAPTVGDRSVPAHADFSPDIQLRPLRVVSGHGFSRAENNAANGGHLSPAHPSGFCCVRRLFALSIHFRAAFSRHCISAGVRPTARLRGFLRA
jgi:hypothetical protein